MTIRINPSFKIRRSGAEHCIKFADDIDHHGTLYLELQYVKEHILMRMKENVAIITYQHKTE